MIFFAYVSDDSKNLGLKGSHCSLRNNGNPNEGPPDDGSSLPNGFEGSKMALRCQNTPTSCTTETSFSSLARTETNSCILKGEYTISAIEDPDKFCYTYTENMRPVGSTWKPIAAIYLFCKSLRHQISTWTWMERRTATIKYVNDVTWQTATYTFLNNQGTDRGGLQLGGDGCFSDSKSKDYPVRRESMHGLIKTHNTCQWKTNWDLNVTQVM